MSSFLLEIITPVRQAFSEEVDMVVAPTKNGSIGILAHHQPLFSSLTEGEIKITSGAKDYFLAIGGGFMEVSRDKVMILVSRAAHADAAKDAIANKAKGIELANVQAMLRRSFIELKVFRRRKVRTPLN